MRITVLSKDNDLYEPVFELPKKYTSSIDLYRESQNPIDVLTHVMLVKPSILVVDDEFTRPESVSLMKSIRKMMPDIYMVFITPSSSLELGRTISEIGIHFYMLKPVNYSMLQESILHIVKTRFNSRL